MTPTRTAGPQRVEFDRITVERQRVESRQMRFLLILSLLMLLTGGVCWCVR